MEAWHNDLLSVEKAYCCKAPHLNVTDFSVNIVRGQQQTKNVGYSVCSSLLVPKMISIFFHIGGGWKVLDSFQLSRVCVDTLFRNGVPR